MLGSLATLDAARTWTDSAGTPIRPYSKYDADIVVPAGTAQKYDFSVSSRFASITPGNKLRLTITTQTPSANCTPVLGVDACFTTTPQTATLTGAQFTVLHGPTQASSINLPLLPASCWVSSDNPSIPFWDKDPKITTAPCQGL